MCIRACFFVEKFDGESEIADDASVVISDEDVFALEVSVGNGGLLCDSVNDPLVVKMGQALIEGNGRDRAIVRTHTQVHVHACIHIQ